MHPCCPVHSVIFPSVQDQSLNSSAREKAGTGDTDEIKSATLSVRRDTCGKSIFCLKQDQKKQLINQRGRVMEVYTDEI